jgi:hypothetical protein
LNHFKFILQYTLKPSNFSLSLIFQPPILHAPTLFPFARPAARI